MSFSSNLDGVLGFVFILIMVCSIALPYHKKVVVKRAEEKIYWRKFGILFSIVCLVLGFGSMLVAIYCGYDLNLRVNLYLLDKSVILFDQAQQALKMAEISNDVCFLMFPLIIIGVSGLILSDKSEEIP